MSKLTSEMTHFESYFWIRKQLSKWIIPEEERRGVQNDFQKDLV